MLGDSSWLTIALAPLTGPFGTAGLLLATAVFGWLGTVEEPLAGARIAVDAALVAGGARLGTVGQDMAEGATFEYDVSFVDGTVWADTLLLTLIELAAWTGA